MPPTTTYSFGDVVLVDFPFTSLKLSKKRPAIVVSSAQYNQARPDLIFVAVTSQVRSSPAFGEVALAHWKRAGLIKPSALKPILVTIEKKLVLRRLGRLDAQDRAELERALGQMLGP